MFNLFKRKTAAEKLEIKYQKLLEESYNLSTTNRTLSDAKRAKAEDVLKEIESLEKNKLWGFINLKESKFSSSL